MIEPTHGWRWYKVENNRLMSPLVGNIALPRDGVLEHAFFMPGTDDMFHTVYSFNEVQNMMKLSERYDCALTFGRVDGPFTIDDAMALLTMRCARYQARIIIADNPLRLQPFYDLPLMANDGPKLSTMLEVERLIRSQGAEQIPATALVADTTRPLHITFVCSYNMGRSPMAAAMFAQQLSKRGLAQAVCVSSAGTSDWAVGSPMDPLGAKVLRDNGYAVPVEHRSIQVNDDIFGADLAVVMEQDHVSALLRCGFEADRVRLLRSFGPGVGGPPYLGVKNPNTAADFKYCFNVIASALPSLHRWVDEQLAASARCARRRAGPLPAMGAVGG